MQNGTETKDKTKLRKKVLIIVITQEKANAKHKGKIK